MSFSSSRQWISQRPYIIALFITAMLCLWMLSGISHTQEAPASSKHSSQVAKVQVKTMAAENIHNTLQLYGRTQANRVSTVMAEVQGKVIEVLATQGARVTKGQPIVKIEKNDLEAQLESSNALLSQREIEYEGAKALTKNGNIGRSQLARALADIEVVKASIKSIRIRLENTTITAPFDGVLNQRMVEVGDYLKVGDPAAEVADLSSLVVIAYATEEQVNTLQVDQTAEVTILKAPSLTGRIRYIASLADPTTNMFKLEVEIANSDYTYRSGISAEVVLQREQQWAIKLTPALLALDESGNIGVKSVVNGKVVFTPIEIVKSDSDGIWLSGLGQQADIITLGQGFVRAGDPVEVVADMMGDR